LGCRNLKCFEKYAKEREFQRITEEILVIKRHIISTGRQNIILKKLLQFIIAFLENYSIFLVNDLLLSVYDERLGRTAYKRAGYWHARTSDRPFRNT
jgi:hypothetical protein